MMRLWRRGFIVAVAIFSLLGGADAEDAVDVTVSLDHPRMVVGQTTTLRVFGQIDGAIEADSERIFSWYIDVLNSVPEVVAVDWATLAMVGSDNVPQTSSTGRGAGAGERRGIYNTFLGRAGAGRGAAIELLRVEVTAVGLGETSFSVGAGTGEAGLAEDFIVARDGGGEPFVGGDYGGASAEAEVMTTEDFLDARTAEAGGGRLEVRFSPVPGKSHRVEVSDDLTDGSWVVLPGAPHQSGVVVDPESGTAVRRFYRVVVADP